MSDKISSDINKFEPGEIIELFELDLSTGLAPVTIPVFRWHSGSTKEIQEIVWQGNKYSSFPIEAEGFEFVGKGAIPRPTITVANITSLLSGVLSTYSDLVGAKVTRKRTFAKYLDSYCYVTGYPVSGYCTGEPGAFCTDSSYTTQLSCESAGEVWEESLSKTDCKDKYKYGGYCPGDTSKLTSADCVSAGYTWDYLAGTWTDYTSTTCVTAVGKWYDNPIADDMAHFPDEIWYIDRKAVETNTHLQFELSAAHDIHGIKLPSRTVVANSCHWRYRGPECGYIGTQYFDIDNNVVSNIESDVCGKTFKSCEKRYPESAPLTSGASTTAGGTWDTGQGVCSKLGNCSDEGYRYQEGCEGANFIWTPVEHDKESCEAASETWTSYAPECIIGSASVCTALQGVWDVTTSVCTIGGTPFGGFPGAGINMGTMR
jgi:phage-related protein